MRLKSCVYSVVMIICLLMSSLDTSAYEVDSADCADSYLLSIGMPEHVIHELPEGQKQLIYETTYGEDVRYVSYEEQNYQVDDEGALMQMSATGTISQSDLTITVVGIEALHQSGLSENTEYKIYPTFVWNKMVKIKNDTFAMAMYSGWSAVPQLRNLKVHIMNAHGGKSLANTDIDPSYSSQYGYAFHIPSSVGNMNEWYEGHAYFTVEKTDSSARPRISVKYIHDTSSLANASYSVNIGLASISVSGKTDKLQIMADNFTISGL